MRRTMAAAAGLTLSMAMSPAWAQGAGRGLDILAAMDANGDGAVTRAEARAARETLFQRLDADDDGLVSQTEREAMRQGQRQGGGRGMGANADADGDGSISRAEFLNQRYRGFDRADTNADGTVSAEEIAALRSRLGGG